MAEVAAEGTEVKRRRNARAGATSKLEVAVGGTEDCLDGEERMSYFRRYNKAFLNFCVV